MSFSSNSSTITQSGTDTDLSRLGSVSGSTVNQIGSTGYRIYTITRKLRINGTLTIDPTKEQLVIDNNKKINCEVGGSGRLNLGNPNRRSAHHAPGATAGTLYGSGHALITGNDGEACCYSGSLRVHRGGTLAMYGAGMRVRGVINLNDGCNFISRDGRIVVESPSNLGSNVSRIRVDANTGVDIIGLRVENAQFDMLDATPFTNFRGYDGRSIPIPIESSPNAADRNLRGTRVDVRDLPDWRPYAKAAVNNWRGAQDLRVINSAAGSATLCVPDQVREVTAANQGSHGGRIYHEAMITVTDEAGTAIEGARVYCADTDNGARVSATTTGTTTIDETADRIYSALTNAQGLVTHTILTGMWYRRDDVSDIPSPNGNELVDVRSKSATAGVDDFDLHVEAYGYQRTEFEAILHGDSAYQRIVVLRPDSSISESAKATVDAYTELSTAAQIYDAILAAKADDPTLGGLGAPIVTRSGNTLDFGSLNVELSTSAKAIAFNADNTTLTLAIGGAAMTANLRTSGTVTSTGITVSGFISDSSGVSSIISVSAVAGMPVPAKIQAYSATGTKLADLDVSAVPHSGTINLTAAQSAAGIKLIYKSLGYAPQILTLDAAAGGAFSVAFNIGIRNDLPSGAAMRVPNQITTGISVAFTLTDLADVSAVINLPNRQVRVQQIYEAFEQALATDDGLKFLAFGGRQVTIDLSPTAGDSLYLNYAGTKLDAAAGAANAQVVGSVWHPDGLPIVGDGSDPAIASGVNLPILSAAISRAVLWTDLDDQQVGEQSLAGEVLAATRAVTDSEHGNANLKTLIDAITATITAVQGDGNNTLATLAAAIAGLPEPVTLTQLNDALVALPDPLTEAQLNSVRDAILAGVNPPLDGTVDRNMILRRIYAVLIGNAVPDENGVAYKRADGSTTEVAYDVADDGTRTQRPA